jgi:Tol biopolymer transport system component
LTSEPARNAVYLGSLDSTERKQVLAVSSRAVYSAPGYLLFAQSGQLMAQPFDVRRGQTTRDGFPVLDQIPLNTNTGGVPLSVSDNGILAFRESFGGLATQLIWYDRNGKALGTINAPGSNAQPTLSPDGQRLAVSRSESGEPDIWLIDLLRGTHSRFTFEDGDSPVCVPDGTMIAFRKPSQGMYQKPASGAGNEELLVAGNLYPGDWSNDGRFITSRRDNNGLDVWALPTFGDRKPFPVLETRFNENVARLSPDGRWIAYTSDESGRSRLYVQSFPPSGGKWQISLGGATFSAWRRDGKEIIFNTPDRKIMAVDVKVGETFEAGVPHVLFEIPAAVIGGGNRFLVTPDGQRFLFPLPASETGDPPITVLTNWTSTIK